MFEQIVGLIFLVIFIIYYIFKLVKYIDDKKKQHEAEEKEWKEQENEIKWIDNTYPLAYEIVKTSKSISTMFFESTPEFYGTFNNGYKGLIENANKICKFIGYSGPPLRISYTDFVSEKNNPAVIEGSTIKIKKEYQAKPFELGTILAHEITHAYINYNASTTGINKESEHLTDLIAICLGLGTLIINGFGEKISSLSLGIEDYTFTEEYHFGYFKYFTFLYAYEKHRRCIKMSLKESNKNLRLKRRFLFKQKFKNKKDEDFVKSEVKSKYLNCKNCGETFHYLESEFMGNEKWICNSCGECKTFEKL